jgi:hypothetical protein
MRRGRAEGEEESGFASLCVLCACCVRVFVLVLVLLRVCVLVLVHVHVLVLVLILRPTTSSPFALPVGTCSPSQR